MAFSTCTLGFAFLLLSLLLSSSSVISGSSSSSSSSQMSPGFYLRSCPRLNRIVGNRVRQALAKEPRHGASLLRLFFHDCFVNGCDGSILLDDTASFTGEKNAFPNRNSARGFEVIDKIKTDVEAACPGTVSCADILALATRFGVRQLGGPSWRLALGRRDARTASQSDANRDLPSPRSNLTTLITSFGKKGLTARDMTALSGAHTIGKAQCRTFRTHIYNETNINPSFAQARQANCPFTGGDSNLADLDQLTPRRFDNGYYRNLVVDKGLLHSDQELFNHGSQDSLVRRYSRRNYLFFSHFSTAMTKMSNISPLTGTNGEIRTNCRLVN